MTRPKKKRGYVLIVVLIIMMVLLVLTYFYSDAIFAELVIARNNYSSSIAFSLAEAGTQEAINLIQTDETTRLKFQTSVDGTTQFSHNTDALIPNGSYSVTIQNSARGTATITSIGYFKVGLRTARREIKVGIAQANINPYDYDGAIFAGGGAGESIADIDFWYAPVEIYGGQVLSNRDINLKFGSAVTVEGAVEANRNVVKTESSTLNCECLIVDDDPLNPPPPCSDNPGCTANEGASPKIMPPVDFDSYKIMARDTYHQYYATAKEFLDLIPKGGSATFNGVVYIDDTLDIKENRSVTINGVLAASGSINVTEGSLVTAPSGGIAGALTQKDFRLGSNGIYSGTGLIYAGDRAQIDSSHANPFNLTGAIITRRTWITGYRVVTIHFDKTIVNATLDDPSGTPVIEINHWEEEY